MIASTFFIDNLLRDPLAPLVATRTALLRTPYARTVPSRRPRNSNAQETAAIQRFASWSIAALRVELRTANGSGHARCRVGMLQDARSAPCSRRGADATSRQPHFFF